MIAGGARRRVVLVVEDDLDLLQTLQDLLESEGYDVFPASHGKQAIEFLNARGGDNPDLVVLDLMMPIVSGWEVLQEIRDKKQLCQIPVIVITGASKEKPAGATAVITKPFNLDDFFKAVETTSAPSGPAA